MERFIGLDGHTSSCTLAVIDEKGKTKRQTVVETNGQALVEFVRVIPGRRHLCLEEGPQSQWLYEILSPHVHDLAVVRGEKNVGNKNDGLDALRLAERMRTGDLGSRIFKMPESLTTLRNLVRSYEMINQDVVRTKNRIKSFYRSRGVSTIGLKGVFSEKDREEFLGRLKPGPRQAVEVLSKSLDSLAMLKGEAQATMIAEAGKHPITRILKTAPGFGPVRAAELLSLVVTPYRFRTTRQFWSYCGLAIVQRSSSDWVKQPDGQWLRAPVLQTRGLTRTYNRMAKGLFKGAAITVITRLGGDPLRADYDRLLEKGTKPNLARLTVARKIAAIVLSMWKSQEVYDPSRHRVKGE
jgi:transposase